MRRRLAVSAVIAAGVAAGCAAAPPPVLSPAPPTYEAKMVALLRLEDRRILRPPDEEVPPPVPAAPGQRAALASLPPITLLGLLDDAEARVRRRAALAIGRVGLSDGIAPLSVRLAQDPEPDVRLMAAFALGLIGDPAASGALVAALTDPDPRVQGRAAEALGLLGDRGSAPAIGEMVHAHIAAGALDGIVADDVGYPKAPEPEAVRLGLYALARLDAFDTLAGALLDAAGRPVSDWWPVAYAFQRVSHPGAAPVLETLLASPGQITRAFAARGLGRLRHAPAVPALLAAAADAGAPQAVRVQAIRALAEMEDRRAEATFAAIVAAAGTAPALRREAISALGRVGGAGSLDLLLDLLTDRSPAIRAAAVEALARVDADAFLAALSGLGDDPHFSVRMARARALALLPAERAAPALEVLLEDEDQRVVPAALRALAAVRAETAGRRLLEALHAVDPVVRQAAAEGLAEVRPPGAREALIAALHAAAGEGPYGPRAAMLAALAAIDPEAARPHLEQALARDRDWAVRVRAAELLRGLDPAADVSAMRPAPPAAAADVEGVAALVAPPYSPQAYIETDRGTIQIELAVLDAPRTVANFIALAGRGFFRGVPVHRVVPDFVVQAGDPRGDGEGGPGYTIRDEINERPYLRGTVGMALDWRDTGGSQFFITHSPQPHLDGRYTAFGHVVSGMDVVDAIEPWDVIRSVRVWNGVEWIGPP